MNKKSKRKNKIIYSLSFVLIFLGLIVTINTYYSLHRNDNLTNHLAILDTDYINKQDHVYLSDLAYDTEKSYVKDGYYMRFDKNSNSRLITLNMPNGTTKTFIKGISAWATSDIIYNISDYNFDKFTTYLGVDATQTNDYFNSGVRFTIFTSLDGNEWKTVYTSEIKKGVDKADQVTIPLKDDDGNRVVNYIRLYANENGNNWWSHWYDDAVYADAKLITDSYVEDTKPREFVKTVEEYDNMLSQYKDEIKVGDFSHINDYSATLLKKEFVKRVDYDILQALFSYSSEYEEAVKWLFDDKDALELYVLGGEADGNYGTSLKVLNELYHKYKNDFNDEENGMLYKKMAITLSLTHSASVGLWVSGAPEDVNDPNGSNAVNRYQIYKDLYLDGVLDNDIFTNLTVEEMRFVMNNIIDDEEIKWLNDFTTKNKSRNPYTYINYLFGYDYTKEQYYDETLKDQWNTKKHNDNEKLVGYGFKDYNITYKAGYPKLWIVFEEGSVCGGLSKTGSNIQGVYGVPSSVVSQPGHAAFIYMQLQNGQKFWRLDNDVSGWGQSGKTEKLSVRMPNGWGSGSYAGSYPASYILLSQSALNDYDKYALAEKMIMSAELFKDDYASLKVIYNKALETQIVNFDAWLGLVNAYVNSNASDRELLELSNRIMTNLKYYPLPMDDLLKIISSALDNNSSKATLDTQKEALLTTISNLEQKNVTDYNQVQASKQVATYLLHEKQPLATFSFESKTITLSENLLNSPVWKYSINSRDFSEDINGDLTKVLTDREVSLINEETEILIKIVGESEDSVYEIEINKAMLPPDLTISDINNTVNVDINDSNAIKAGYNKDALEYRFEGEDLWHKLSDGYDFSGNKVVEIRIGSHGTFVNSDYVTFNFTGIGESDKYFYITEGLDIADVSSEYNIREDNLAKNVLDDDESTIWHTDWDGKDLDRYITLKLDTPLYVSALEYVPRQASVNGIVTKAAVYTSMDGENFEQVDTTVALDWKVDKASKFAVFKNPTQAKYIKLVGVETAGDGRSFMSAASIRLFEDATTRMAPKAEIEYSTKSSTTGSVTAKLVNPTKDITITNNGGSNTYTFNRNGSFTFEYKDAYGNVGMTTATVNWIVTKTENKEDSNKEEDNKVVDTTNNNDNSNSANDTQTNTNSTTTNKNTTSKNPTNSNSNNNVENNVDNNNDNTDNNTNNLENNNIQNNSTNNNDVTIISEEEKDNNIGGKILFGVVALGLVVGVIAVISKVKKD